MRWLMLKSKVWAEVFKQSLVMVCITALLLLGDIESLKIAVIMFGLVVLNNTVVVVSRAIAKRKVIAPTKWLITLLHLPERYSYILILIVIVSMAMAIYYFTWGRV